MIASLFIFIILGYVFFKKSPPSLLDDSNNIDTSTLTAEQFKKAQEPAPRNADQTFADPALEAKRQAFIKELTNKGLTVTEKKGQFMIKNQKAEDYFNTHKEEITQKIKADLANLSEEMMRKNGATITPENQLTDEDKKAIQNAQEQMSKFLKSNEYKNSQQQEKDLVESQRH